MLRRNSALRPALVAALAALALAACGRRGPLEAPPNAAKPDPAKTTTITENVVDENPAFGTTSVIGKPPRTNRSITVPKQSFVLDPLL